ncbi:MAG: hypothetical protein KGI04_00305 [Candidatus Micrarchaeota archaeon]|nr:hypothetical protein [Candidatus Micrarchaeota archaeon]
MKTSANKGLSLPAWRLSLKQIIALVVVLVAVYLVYGVLVPSVVTITSARSLSLAYNQTQFLKIYNGSTAALDLQSTSPSGASFYITSVPVLYGPVVSFSLTPESSLNVSTDGSHAANINIRLVSSSNTGATIELTPLPSALGISISPSVTLLNPSSLLNIGPASGGSPTTISSGSSTLSSTLTTTVAQNNTSVTFQQALQLMNKTGPGELMNGLRSLYARDYNCTPSLYNQTYKTYNHAHTQPPAPVSYYNVSYSTPTKMSINESSTSNKDNVLITYSTTAADPGSTGIALLAIINVSNAAFLRNITYTGIFTGLNYSVLNASYSFERLIPNACAALIPQ